MIKQCYYLIIMGVLLVGVSCKRAANSVSAPENKTTEKKIPNELKNKQAEKIAPKVVFNAHLSADWYNQVPTKLDQELDNYLMLAQQHFYVEADTQMVKALIVPHAGYYYSGLCAATAYQTLLTTKNLYSQDIKNKQIKRVIILAPSHTTFFNGVALPDFNVYKTVFGDLNVDERVIRALGKHQAFRIFPDAYKTEHSLEVQLPWIQKTIDKCTIVPLIVGHIPDAATASEIGNELKKILDDTTLIVVSSDFVHHGKRFEYNLFKNNILNQVRMIDSLVIEGITKQSMSALDQVLEETGANVCGKNPLKILMAMLERGDLGAVESRLCCYYTSVHNNQARKQSNTIDIDALMSNVPDDKAQESVSYASMIFTQQKLNDLKLENRLTMVEKKNLLALSRDVLMFALKDKDKKADEDYPCPMVSSGMRLTYGAFVTLKTKKDGALRGCIGNTYAYQQLFQTVIAMTKAAAFNDDRFKPVTQKELNDLIIDITILSKPQRVAKAEDIEVGKHGVIFNKFRIDGSMASSVFLPQVAREQQWCLTTMLEQLSLKAGLDKDAWLHGAEFYVFEGHEFSDERKEKPLFQGINMAY